jgi:hypothetical protein
MNHEGERILENLVQRIAGEIERYCIAHPHARDTADGISWWVQLQRQAEIRDSVPEAIELLIARGVLVRRVAPGGTPLFGYRSQSKE